MARKTFLLLLLLLPLLSFGNPFDFLKKAPNRLKDNRKHGRWVEFHDAEKKVKLSKGRYNMGNEVGTWRYYYEDGRLAKKEQYKRGNIYTTNYYPNGRIRNKGMATIEETDRFVEYFYQGNWKYYTESGHLFKIVQFERGEEAAVQYY